MAYITSRVVGFKAFTQRMKRRANTRAVSETLHKSLSAAWHSGAEQFIKAAVLKVLVETGMTASTFFPLAKVVKRVNAINAVQNHIASNVTRNTKPGIPTFPSGHNRSGFRSRAEGRRLGQNAYKFTLGSPERPVFQFAFETVAFQHAFHDLPPQNRRSMEAGEEAFRRAVRVRITRNPRLIMQAYLQGRNTKLLRLQGLGEDE